MQIIQARSVEYLGHFVFLDFFVFEAFKIDPPPDQKRKMMRKMLAESGR